MTLISFTRLQRQKPQVASDSHGRRTASASGPAPRSEPGVARIAPCTIFTAMSALRKEPIHGAPVGTSRVSAQLG